MKCCYLVLSPASPPLLAALIPSLASIFHPCRCLSFGRVGARSGKLITQGLPYDGQQLLVITTHYETHPAPPPFITKLLSSSSYETKTNPPPPLNHTHAQP
jgi:hypothetical protein